MTNPMTRNLRQEMIDQQKLDIPYDSDGFIKWLIESAGMEEREATGLCDRILIADIELWSPGDPELFLLIAELIEVGKKANEMMRLILNYSAIETIAGHINYLEELKDSTQKKSLDLLNDVIEAYKWYLRFMEDTIGAIPEYLRSMEDILGATLDDFDQTETVRYAPVPLDNEFKMYLDESKYTRSSRDKMLTNLRKLNTLVIDNGRGDSKWLENMVKKASQGGNINSKRVVAHRLVHYALAYTKDFNLSESSLRGGLTALNAYIRFLIHRKKKDQSST